MKCTIPIMFYLLLVNFVYGQGAITDWYSESDNNGIIIQNSFPKGGPYTGPTTKNYNYSYLVFFTRIKNETEHSLELAVNFSADSIKIPNSSDTYLKVFLPSDTMTMDKQNLFSYGITELASFEKATQFKRIVDSKKDCYLYVVAIFYQTREDAWEQYRGGNRAEFVLKGQDLFYNMHPQIDSMLCGHITLIE